MTIKPIFCIELIQQNTLLPLKVSCLIASDSLKQTNSQII